ncbi:coiled-coil domain-containing protein 15 isoform X2 [Hypomesus transpacificus]|uniref:coiled-coil domain-containing protein 15 isoform X2 n=1 Tax=Hypomesus transpacificus TaxID=137520 RepID=UPI001F072AC9|nr:coiled-coil domain-containing protein 15 isoform X2 [Hypomesus transpacificus]
MRKVKNPATVSVSVRNAPCKHGDRNKVLAERNQAVMPVGAWVESGHDNTSPDHNHPAVRAILTEALQVEVLRQKEQNLQRFQDEVRRRVAQQAQILKRRQLQKSCESVEREGRVLQQSSDAAQCFTPRKKCFPSYPHGELAICSPNSCWVEASRREYSEREYGTQLADLRKNQLSHVMRKVRHRLAACQTVSDGEVMSELPGGLWKVSPTRDKPFSSFMREAGEEKEEKEQEEEGEGEDEDIPLTGQHDCPLFQQNVDPCEGQVNKTVTFDSNPVCERLLKEPYPSGTNLGFSTDYRATQVLWPQDDQEELKRQRQSQFLMYRRLFMDNEREQVKEHQRHRKHLKRIARIKAEKEQIRLEEEQKIEKMRQLKDDRLEMSKREFLILQRLRLDEEERAEAKQRRERARKTRESTRYIEALQAQMKERIVQEKVELPHLCWCGDSFWDSHPDTCANNCVFYNNPKAYVQALQSALWSCDLKEGTNILHHKGSARRIASIHVLSPRK